MENEEREKAIAKIRKFVDSAEEVDGKFRFATMDGVSAIYSIALLILDMYEKLEVLEARDNDYDTRNRKFASMRNEL